MTDTSWEAWGSGVLSAFFAGLFTWGVTLLGAATVFFTFAATFSRPIPSDASLHANSSTLFSDLLLASWSALHTSPSPLWQIAASYFSLLAPAVDLARASAAPTAVAPAVGLSLGVIALSIINRYLPAVVKAYNKRTRTRSVSTVNMIMNEESIDSTDMLCVKPANPNTQHDNDPEQVPQDEPEEVVVAPELRRMLLLVIAITVHNAPEGLAVGVAFGSAAAGTTSLTSAMLLALGIGIQNFPEGMAVSVPLRREGVPMLKSFCFGQLSGAVEVVCSVLGAMAVLVMSVILPYALAFAAGCMLWVVVVELIPESQVSASQIQSGFSVMFGFLVMMVLDLSFG